MADAIEHGTTTRGERHGGHKLKESDVREILDRLSHNETHESIAAKYGVSRNAITDIAKGKNWAWMSSDTEDGTGRGTPLVAVDLRNGVETGDTAMPVQAGGHGPDPGGTPHVLVAYRDWFRVMHRSAVRRLTPRECERLQGFPDDWTAVPYRGKVAADGPRYRAIGNSMAVPVVFWLGRRIQTVEDMQ